MHSLTIISSKTDSFPTYLSKIWRYRKLIILLAGRDIKLRYRQTIAGWLWTILQPAMSVALFTFFFTYIIKIEDSTYSYPVMVWCGIVNWNFFSFIVINGGSVLINSQELIKKVYFPKIVLIISKGLVGVTDYLVSLFIITLLALFLTPQFPKWIILIPAVMILNILISLTVAIWAAALSVRYRDILQILPHALNIGMWLTPVFYSNNIIPQSLKFMNYINPMNCIIQSTRWVFLGSAFPAIKQFAAIPVMLLLLIAGLYIFKQTEKDIADYI